MIAEEEVQPQERQLALRPADMSFEQAMLHYMAQMNDRQGFHEGSDMTCIVAEACCFCMMQYIVRQGLSGTESGTASDAFQVALWCMTCMHITANDA